MESVAATRRGERWRTSMAAAALSLVVGGCASAGLANAIRVDAAVPARPAVVISGAGDSTGTPFPFYGLVVSRCQSDSVMWQIGASADVASPTRVEYGVVPRGFTEGVPAHVLEPGCYTVYISGPAHARFTVPAGVH
jgi:hypothetical protein